MAFDSREYEYADITLMVGGTDIRGIRAIKSKEKIEREALYAKGRLPHSIQSGNISFEGEVVMLQSSYLALRAAGNGSILNIVADILTTYGNPSQGDAAVTDRDEGCRFMEAEMGMKQGEKFMEVTVPYICLRKVNNV